MEVILRQDVDSLGLRGEVVNVARGYARNFLLPRGLAEVATPGLVRELEKRDRQRARHEAKSGDEAKSIATRLESLELRFDVNAGPTGALFGSVTATNVADRLWESEKIRIDRRKLSMDAIKRVGRYTVPVEVFADVVAGLKLVVAPEGQELPPQETLDELAAEEAAEQEAAEAAQAAAQQSSAREARAAEEEAAEPAEATPEPVEATPETADADPAFEPEPSAATEPAAEGSGTEPAGSPAPGDDRATEPS